MISKDSIDKVVQSDILEVFNKVLPNVLKRAGSNYKCLSPLINEKSPSFVVSHSKNIWKCFSSGDGGIGPVSFIIKWKKTAWIEAIEFVADVQNIILERIELNDEEKERQETLESQRVLLERSKIQFRKYFCDLSDFHWAKENIIKREFSEETIEQFQIGYAVPNANDFTLKFKEKGKFLEAKEAGLVMTKDGNDFDFFNDKLIFPILDDRGRAIGFGGRTSPEKVAQKQSKFINSSDTFHYKKSLVLYGWFQASQSIVKNNAAYLAEGYCDVIGFHDKNISNTIATCGTALTLEQVKKIKKKCSHIILIRDGDSAGIKATYRDIDMILEAGMKASIVPMPADEDPDSIARIERENLQQWLDSNIQDAIIWKSAKLKQGCKNPDEISFATTDICESLLKINDPIKRKAYAKLCSKKLGVSIKDLSEKIDTLVNLEKKKQGRDKEAYADEKFELMGIGFPEDGDVKQYKKDGYVCAVEEKAIYFYSESEKSCYFFKGTNFIIQPLFTIEASKGQGKRLIELENNHGEKVVIAFDNKEISNFSQFKEKIIDGYNFTFDGKTSNFHFTQFRNKMMYNFEKANQIVTYGSQPEGFDAFANGIVIDGIFFEVDDYGMADVKIEADEEEGVKEFSKKFYLPAFSKVNKGNREDDDDHEGIRKYIFIESDLIMNQWMDLFYKVYGAEKAMIGIAFMMASVFRSFIVQDFGSFPFLFLTGSKNSGKTTFCESITNLFIPNEKAFDLNSGSMAGFYRVVSRYRDIVIGMEEFTDQIQDVKFQSLKGSYDDRARETAQQTNDGRTNKVRIKSACIILSQYLSVRDDNALTSRSITMNFLESNYTAAEKATFSRLKTYEKKGMTSMILELIKHRKLISKEFPIEKRIVTEQLLKDIKGEYMERMLQNFITIMVPVKILYKNFNWPFSWQEFYDYCLETISAASDVISDTEGTATFWRTLEFLVDNKRIHDKVDFFIEPKYTFTVWPKKHESVLIENKDGNQILFLRLGTVHQHYVEAVSRRKNEEPIGEATLRGYFKAKPYYIGAVKAINFETGSQSCYAFNYTMMEKMGILNIVRDFSKTNNINPDVPGPITGSFSTDEQEDLPF